MRRTTISLPDEIAAALEREARRQSLPVSAIARDAIAAHLGFGNTDNERALPFASVGKSGLSTTARDMEVLLQREWDRRARGS
jgi:CubicO group peptidase (beta-lactamase class C family)